MDIEEACFTLPINPNNFPSKLWRLVNDPQIRSICWDTTGEGIILYQEPFEEEVLVSPQKRIREYFKTTSLTSFFRQLNLYGFRKVHADHDISEKQRSKAFFWAQMHHFHSPNFKRDNPDLLVNLTRLTPANKAKIAAGLKLTSKSTRHFSYQKAESPKEKENSPVMEKMENDSLGSVMVEEIPYNHREIGFQEVKDCDRTPQPSQAVAMDQGNPGSMFHHYPMDWPYSHPSSSMHMHEGSQSSVPDGTFIPSHSQYTFYTPVYPYCGPGSLDSNTDFSQQPATPNAYCGYYPDYFANYFHYDGQNPGWQADKSTDPSESDVNQDSAAKVEDKLQVKKLVCVAPGVYRRS